MARTATLSPDAVTALRAATVTEDRVTLNGQLDPKVYRELKTLLGRIGGGGVWNRKQGTHLFPKDPRPELADLLGDSDDTPVVMPVDRDKELSFWRTPDALAARMVRAALPPQPSYMELSDEGEWPDSAMTRVLEPSAGDGAILRALALACRERTDVSVLALEPDEHRHAALVKGLNEPGQRLLFCHSQRRTLEQHLTLTHGDDPWADVVLMNPPFTLPGRPCAWAEHVTRCLTVLRPGGVLVAVLPVSWETRDHPEVRTLRAVVRGLDEQHARRHEARIQWHHEAGNVVQDEGPITHVWERLPEDTFAASGTLVRTGLLTVRIPD